MFKGKIVTLVLFCLSPAVLMAATPAAKGPRLSDKEFFAQLDLTRPGLEKVRSAVKGGNLEDAKTEFLVYMRARKTPTWWLDWRKRQPKTTGYYKLDKARIDGIMRHMRGPFHLGDDINWSLNPFKPGAPNYTREWTWGLNRLYHWRNLGKAYWDTGDEKYAKEWIAQMRDWVEDNPCKIDGGSRKAPAWRTIEAGLRAWRAYPDSLHYFLGSPSLTGDDLVMFMKSWIDHAERLKWITLIHPNRRSNWVAMECNGLGHIAILFPECRNAADWKRIAADRLRKELRLDVYPDGVQIELTPTYHEVTRKNCAALFHIAKWNKVPLSADYLKAMEPMYEYCLKAMTPELRIPPLNDSAYIHIKKTLLEGDKLFDRQDFLWAATGGKQGKKLTFTSVAFPWAGQYVMRSGWGKDDLYLMFESGPFGKGHQHEDKLSMFAYGLGRVLLTEAGCYHYDHSKYRKYVIGSWAHNTILVDGLQQHRKGLGKTYVAKKPVNNLWIHNKVFDAADGVYNSGYGPKRETRVKHERTVVFLRGDYWVVLDRLFAKGKHNYDILWHLNNKAASYNAKTLAAWGKDPKVANLLVTPTSTKNLKLDIVVGRDEPVLGFAPMRGKNPIPTLDYKLQKTGDATLGWVLTPYRSAVPSITVSLVEHKGGSIITVVHPKGKDTIYIAARETTWPVKVGEKQITVAGVYVERTGPADQNTRP